MLFSQILFSETLLLHMLLHLSSFATIKSKLSPNNIKKEERNVISSVVLPFARQQAKEETKVINSQDFAIFTRSHISSYSMFMKQYHDSLTYVRAFRSNYFATPTS